NASADAFGYSLSEVVGQKWEVLMLNPDDREKVKELVTAVMQGHPSQRITVVYRCKDGHDCPMFVYLYAMPDGAGQIDAMIFASAHIDSHT
ncbi:MAG: PAS domain-containing protein, partial [Chlorobiales bacterium]|nr:PAS domain-containing protein [Chlorobiales bacterium]